MNKKGFICRNTTYIEEINAKVHEYYHVKSKAQLFYIENDDENKNLSIGFKTIPDDNTGVFHILEHAIMSGSKNYPLKAPMIYMMKNSMQTYLNASTFPDKTIYQVSSCNEKDFENLMDVYLDAVFNPLLSKETFAREGWHYELLAESDDVYYNGVVFNEMKGSEASIYKRLYMTSMNNIYKDTCYRYNSGGSPAEIVNLSYADFLNTYKKYYNVDNCVICLYGKMDLESKLEKIARVLSKAHKGEKIQEVSNQEPFIKEFTSYYPLSKTDSLDNNTYMTLSYCLGEYDNFELFLAVQLLLNVLLGSNTAPLKKALLAIASDVSAFLIDGKQISLTIALIKANTDSKDRFEEIVNEVLTNLRDNGLNQEDIESALNNIEFNQKENALYGTSKGINYATNIISSVFYNCPPDTRLLYKEAFNKIRSNMNQGYFENLISELLLKSKHKVLSLLMPSHEKSNEDKALEIKRLMDYQNTLSIDDKIVLINDTKKMQVNKPDKKAALAQMPQLSLKDISHPREVIDTKIVDDIIFHETKIDEIVYLNYYFSLCGIDFADLTYVTILGSVLTRTSSINYDVKKLENMIKRYTGSLVFEIDVISKTDKECMPFLVLRVAALKENISKIEMIINEILTNSRLDINEIKQIINQDLHYLKMSFAENGNAFASKLASRGIMAEASYTDKLSGYEYYSDLKKICAHLAEHIEKLKSIYHKLFTNNNLTVSIASTQATLNKFSKLNLDPGSENQNRYCVNNDKSKRLALSIPSQVSFVNVSASLQSLGYKYNGKLIVLAKLVSLSYLWSEIREKGGAYGCNMSISRNGNIMMSSYRDPNPLGTIAIMKTADKFLENLTDEIKGLIISAIANFDRPKTLKQGIIISDHNYFLGISNDDVLKVRAEIITTTLADILSYKDLLKKFNQKMNYAVVGKIEEKAMFDEVKEL